MRARRKPLFRVITYIFRYLDPMTSGWRSSFSLSEKVGDCSSRASESQLGIYFTFARFFAFVESMDYPSSNPVRFPDFQASAQRWRIIDTDVPMREVLRWYVKLTIPALLFILAACAICYFTVDLIMGMEARAAFEHGRNEFGTPKPFRH